MLSTEKTLRGQTYAQSRSVANVMQTCRKHTVKYVGAVLPTLAQGLWLVGKHWPRETNKGMGSGGRGKAEQGVGRAGGSPAQGGGCPREGPSLVNLDRIITPSPVGLPWAAQSYVSEFAGAALSSPIGTAVAQHGVKRITPVTLSCATWSPNHALETRWAIWPPCSSMGLDQAAHVAMVAMGFYLSLLHFIL